MKVSSRPEHQFSTVWPTLAAALLFGASTPFVKLLVGELPALLLAGLGLVGWATRRRLQA